MKRFPVSTLLITTTIFALTASLNLSDLTSFKLTSETQIIIQNLRYIPVDSVALSDVDPHDFEAGSGPLEKLKDLSIPARRSVQRNLEVNSLASRAPFTMELRFNDGSVGSFHINMKYALGEKDAEFRYEAPFRISFKKIGNTIIIVLED